MRQPGGGSGILASPVVESYRIEHLVGDVRALVDHLGLSKLTVVCQDWGALVGWSFALRHPELIRRFVTVNITHPALFNRDLRENPKQQEASQYMLSFRTPGFDQHITADDFAFARQAIFEDARKHGASLSAEDEDEWLQALKQPGAVDAGLKVCAWATSTRARESMCWPVCSAMCTRRRARSIWPASSAPSSGSVLPSGSSRM
jgi:pimeloyl-ACP methyl ester carboxylesterase